MPDFDTSMYLKPSQVPSALDYANQFNQAQQQQLAISQAKLDQANQGLQYLGRAVSSLGPLTTPDWREKYKAAGDQVTRQLGLDPSKTQIWNEEVDAAPDGPTFFKRAMSQIAGSVDHILNLQTGRDTTATDSLNNYQGKSDVLTNSFRPGSHLPVQLAPGTPNVDNRPQIHDPRNPGRSMPNPNYNQPGYVGASGPPGVVQDRLPNGLPVEGSAAPASNRMPVQAAQQPQPQQPRVATAPAPNFEEGKKQRAGELQESTAKATALKPLEEAYDLAHEVATGPGTETLYKARSYLHNFGLVKADEKDPVAIYGALNKLLNQTINESGPRSNEDEALKRNSNPNTSTQIQPTLLKVARDMIGRKKIEIARPLAFEGTDYQNYGTHSATFPTNQDQRAYITDKMDPNEARALYLDMKNKAKNGKSNERQEAVKFLKSYTTAKKLGLVKDLPEAE